MASLSPPGLRRERGLTWSGPITLGLVLTVVTSACSGQPDDVVATNTHVENNPPVETNMVEDLYINSELVDCEGVAPQQCMQVRTSPDSDWELFYGQVEGFMFEPGYTYKLRVRVTPAESAPADASTLRYVLIEVEEKRSTPPS
jgi:hypothetical protein